MSYVLIDPPITPYSTDEEVLEWIAELEAMPQSEQVNVAINSARTLLIERENRNDAES